MGLRVRKSFKVAPGVRVNVGKTRSSVSVGGKGLTTNISKRGVKTTASIPGTGLSYSTKPASKKRANTQKNVHDINPTKPSTAGTILSRIIGILFIAIISVVILSFLL